MTESHYTPPPSKKSLTRVAKWKGMVIHSDVENGFQDDDSDDSSFHGDIEL